MKIAYFRYFKNRLINKILIMYVAIIVLILSILSIFISSFISSILIANETQANDIILKNIDIHMLEKSKHAKSMVYQAYLSRDLLETNRAPNIFTFLLTKMEATSSEFILNKPTFDKFFQSAFSQDADIAFISVFKTIDGTVYNYRISVRYTLPASQENVNESLKNKYSLLYPEIKPYMNPSFLVPNYDGIKNNLYSIIMPIADIDKHNRMIGYITIYYDVNEITRYISQFTKNLEGEILILTKPGKVIYDSANQYYEKQFPNMSIFEKTENKVKLDGKNYYVSSIPSSADSMVIARIIPEDVLMKNIHTIQLTIFLASFICVVACVLLMYVGSKRISSKIKIIIKFIKEIQKGNFRTRIPITKSEDELDQIAGSFNKMSENLVEYIERILDSEFKQKNSELKQKNAELMALQAQINPHFLYNSLEEIRMKAVLDGSKDAGNMIFILSKLFRNQIKGDQVVTIAEEIKFCELYLDFFKISYGDQFSYIISADDNVLEFGIIRHLIQPVIENCIVHGINARISNYLIEIHAHKSGNTLLFSIKDNGRGIDPSALVALEESLKSTYASQRKSIGLHNVNERILMIFGSDYGLSITSEVGKGTEVILKIPATDKEELLKYVQGTVY